jgi:hypothetical protein
VGGGDVGGGNVRDVETPAGDGDGAIVGDGSGINAVDPGVGGDDGTIGVSIGA